MKTLLKSLVAITLIGAACTSNPNNEGEPGATQGSGVELGDQQPEATTTNQPAGTPDDNTSDPGQSSADVCVSPAGDAEELPLTTPMVQMTPGLDRDALAGAGEPRADLFQLATYGEGTDVDPEGLSTVERSRPNPCALFALNPDVPIHQCREEGDTNDQIEAYIRTDRYLVWRDGRPETVDVEGDPSVQNLMTALSEATPGDNTNGQGGQTDPVIGFDYILFPSMGYGVFPFDHPTSVGVYSSDEQTLDDDTHPYPRSAPPSTGGDATIVIADTGYVASPPPFDFLDRVSPYGEVETLPDLTSSPATAHGLMVAGVAAQRAPGAEVIVVKAVDTELVEDPYSTDHTTELMTVYSFASTMLATELSDSLNDFAVLNMSFGSYACDDEQTKMAGLGDGFDVLREVLGELQSNYVLVAAAGNNRTDIPSYPAAIDGVIGVAAIDDTVPPGTDGCGPSWSRTGTGRCAPDMNQRAHFSNHGSWVDVCAPGTDMITAYPEDLHYGYLLYDHPTMTVTPTMRAIPGPLVRVSGTSLAVPYVAAQIASLPGETTESLRARLADGDDLGVGTTCPKR